MRHVALNAVFLKPGMGGMHAYVSRLVPALRDARPDVRLTLVVGDATIAAEPWTAGCEVVTHRALGLPGLTLAAELTLVARLTREADLLHSLAMTGPLRSRRPHVVTVPDLIWWHRPESSGRLTTTLWRAAVPPIARAARRVLTISEASKADVVRLLRVPAGRVDVTLCGPGSDPVAPAEPPALGPFVLCASAHRPHKNLVRLVEAMASLPGCALVITGGRTEHTPQLEAAAARHGVRLVLPGFVSAEQLEALYAAAAAFAYPSLVEGFGLPVLEAMRRGVPVACSATSAVGEVAGEAAATFDPHDVASIAAALRRALDDPAPLVAAGRARASTFTWERCARQTWDAYDRALG